MQEVTNHHCRGSSARSRRRITEVVNGDAAISTHLGRGIQQRQQRLELGGMKWVYGSCQAVNRPTAPASRTMVSACESGRRSRTCPPEAARDCRARCRRVPGPRPSRSAAVGPESAPAPSAHCHRRKYGRWIHQPGRHRGANGRVLGCERLPSNAACMKTPASSDRYDPASTSRPWSSVNPASASPDIGEIPGNRLGRTCCLPHGGRVRAAAWLACSCSTLAGCAGSIPEALSLPSQARSSARRAAIAPVAQNAQVCLIQGCIRTVLGFELLAQRRLAPVHPVDQRLPYSFRHLRRWVELLARST